MRTPTHSARAFPFRTTSECCHAVKNRFITSSSRLDTKFARNGDGTIWGPKIGICGNRAGNSENDPQSRSKIVLQAQLMINNNRGWETLRNAPAMNF